MGKVGGPEKKPDWSCTDVENEWLVHEDSLFYSNFA